jgi:N-acetylneuraminic acid mutarotase
MKDSIACDSRSAAARRGSLLRLIVGIIALLGGFHMWSNAAVPQQTYEWHDLPQLPQSLAGQCVGTIGKLLVVAGGSSWTKPPWAGGTKHWSDEVLALAPGGQQWQLIGHLPHPLAYGSAVQVGKEMLCIGGQDAEQTYNTALQLGLDGKKLTIRNLPNLPQPLTNAQAALAGDKVFVVGGQHTLNAKDVSSEIWSLNLSDPRQSQEWKGEPSPPWKHARILPVVAGCGHDLYVLSGADLSVDNGGTSHRTYLSDAWRLKEGASWEKLPDLPSPVTGAPSLCDESGSVVVFGGDNGSLAEQITSLKDQHPGFSLKTLRFGLPNATWTTGSQLPVSLVTTGATLWDGQYVIAGGENKPGHRSSRVIAMKRGG